MSERQSLFQSRVTCPVCAVQRNETVTCTLAARWGGYVVATCPECGHRERFTKQKAAK